MAFITLEDLLGTVEIIVFPKDYDKYSAKLVDDCKIFVKGRVSVEEDRDGKLVCEKITAFEEIPRYWGIMTLKGKVIVDAKYEKVEIHDGGIAVVTDITGKTQTIYLK